MTSTETPKQAKEKVPETQWLNDVAIFLQGYKLAKGNLSDLGLGNIHITELYEAIRFIQRNKVKFC